MAGDTIITLTGNLTDDPELRFTPSGAAVANFTIASTPSTFNRQSNEWEDGETLFIRASIWRQAAENVAESLTKGMRVIAQGKLKARSYETREGEKRTVFELEVDEIGPSLRGATAKIAKTTRQTGGQQSGARQQNTGVDPWAQPQQSAPQAPTQGSWGAPPQQQGSAVNSNDPWATAGAADDAPPF